MPETILEVEVTPELYQPPSAYTGLLLVLSLWPQLTLTGWFNALVLGWPDPRNILNYWHRELNSKGVYIGLSLIEALSLKNPVPLTH